MQLCLRLSTGSTQAQLDLAGCPHLIENEASTIGGDTCNCHAKMPAAVGDSQDVGMVLVECIRKVGGVLVEKGLKLRPGLADAPALARSTSPISRHSSRMTSTPTAV